MVSIGSLKYDIIADTSNFTKGVTASKRELTAAKKVFLETRTPVEKMGIEVEGLNRLLKKGAIDQKTYARATKQLKHEAALASGGLKKMSAQIKNMGVAGKALIAGLAIQGGRRAVGGFMGVLGDADEIIKTSRKLGLAKEELVGLRLAAEQFSGMGASQVDMALQRMTRRLSEAANGTGEARAAIAELGLDAQQLNQRGPAAAFRQIADAIKRVKSPADQLRLAFKLFDSEGAALVNTLKAGSGGLLDMQKKAVAMGLAFRGTADKDIEAANDAISDLKNSFGGLTRSVAVSFTPAIRKAADATRMLATAIRDVGQATKWTWGEMNKTGTGMGTDAANFIGRFFGFDPVDIIGNKPHQRARPVSSGSGTGSGSGAGRVADPFAPVFGPSGSGGLLKFLGINSTVNAIQSAMKKTPTQQTKAVDVRVTDLAPAASRASRAEYAAVARINNEANRWGPIAAQKAQTQRTQQLTATNNVVAAVNQLLGQLVGV